MTELQNGLLQDSVIEKDYIVMDNQTYYIKASIYDDCYNEGNFVGTFVMKRLEFEYPEDIDFKQKEFKFYKSFKINGEWQTIDYGTFIVQSIEQSDTEETVKITAYDYALKFAQPYETELDYASGKITLWQVFEEILNKMQIVTDLTSFTNSDFIVDSNQFVEGYSYGNVMAQIAGISGNFAHIYEDKMCLIFTNETGIVIEKSQYSEFEDKRDANPITIVVIEDAVIEGENISKRWEEGIELYGENYFTISGNLFAYTQVKRQQLINALFDKIKGFSYSSMKLTDCLFPTLKCGDKVQIRAKDGSLVNSLVLRWQNTDYEHTLEAPSVIKATVEYETPENVLDLAKRAEIIVNKQNQTIEGVVSQTNEQNQKINRVVQTVDELNSKIGDVADITVSKDSNNGILEFENINVSEPIRIEIRPTGVNFSHIYPNSNLFPSNILYPLRRTIRFTNIEDETVREYEIPQDLLYFNENYYDEFILDYDSQTCIVNKRVGYNEDGTTYILDTPTTIEYEYPTIPLTDGDYRIELLGATPVYMFVRLMSQNIYTTQFATKAEMHSEISAASTSIKAEVNADIETLDQNVDREVTNLNAKLELKVDTKNLVSEINASADVIRLGSNRLIINSDNFKLTEDGVIDAVSGEVGGYQITDSNFSAEIYPDYDFTGRDTLHLISYISGQGSLTDEQKELYDINKDGILNSADLLLMVQLIHSGITTTEHGKIYINKKDPINTIVIKDASGNQRTRIGITQIRAENVYTGNLSADNIQSGEVLITPEANVPTSVMVEFENVYSEVPNVVVSPVTTVPGTRVTGVSVSDITETGFTIWLTRTNNTETSVQWIAMS